MEVICVHKMIKCCLAVIYFLILRTPSVYSSDLWCPEKCVCLGNYVECGSNNLSTVPSLPNWVQNLDLSSNQLNVSLLENSIRNLKNLSQLKIEKNSLPRIPIFTNVPELKGLNLAHNAIKTIDITSLERLKGLTILELKKNSIKSISAHSFPAENNLSKLYLNGNQISAIDDNAFGNLTHLQELRLGMNRITSIPMEALKRIKNIKKLELNNNELVEIQSQCFQNLGKLRVLKLKNNKIEKIYHDAFSGASSLTNLDLSSNSLTTLQNHHFKGLANLRELFLDGNRISFISDGAFNTTPNLEILILSNNRISLQHDDASQMPKFVALKQLESLSLNSNHIKYIQPTTFSGLNNLKILDLNQNDITTIQVEGFHHLTGLQTLKINSNKLICDCNLGRFYNWLKIHDVLQVTAVCEIPNWLHGIRLKELRSDNFTCYETLKPKITEEPKNQVVIKGTNMTLTCVATSSSLQRFTISWKRDNVDLSSDLYAVSFNKSDVLNNTMVISELKVASVDQSSSGKYQCIASNEHGSTYSGKSKIVVATYPAFTKVPINITIEAGATAKLDCAATGDPQPQIAWQKDGGHDFPAARERRMLYMPQDVSFYIVTSTINDQGVYTCTAENSVGIITANATLTINAAPSFIKNMENKEVISGKSIVLECMATGSPKPSLRWLKDNQTIDTTERHFFAADNQLLIIVDAKFTDSGNYKCEIENDLGRKDGTTNLTVNPVIIAHTFNFRDMMGVVIITVFCCAVVTSIVWVIIIYQTKKRNHWKYKNGDTTKLQYRSYPPPVLVTHQNGETTFTTGIIPNVTLPSSPKPAYNYSTNDCSTEEEMNPLRQNIDEPDCAGGSPRIVKKLNSSQRQTNDEETSPLPSPPPTPIATPTPPSPTISSSSTPLTTVTSDITADMGGVDTMNCDLMMTKLNHNLHENKLNKFDSMIMNGHHLHRHSSGGGCGGGGGHGGHIGSNVGNANSKISCISICSLDSVHSLKQSL